LSSDREEHAKNRSEPRRANNNTANNNTTRVCYT